MTTDTLNPLQETLSATRHTPIKIIASLLVISYGVVNFSVHYWIFLALIIVAVLAFSHRISALTLVQETSASKQQRVVNTDGGSFSQVETTGKVRNASPIVQDGGIYNRKH